MTFRLSSAPEDLIRQLIRRADRACLSTGHAGAEADAPAWPFGSLVMLACDHDATPILLMSDLSEHARNVARDPRASLLIDGTAGLVDALTGPRVTLLGRVTPETDPVLRRRYLSRHPRAGFYAGFADFNIYRFSLIRAHLVAGFGKVHWLEAAAIFTPAPWRDIEPSLIARFADQAPAIAAQAGLASGSSVAWEIIGVDPEGIDLRAGAQIGRLDFPAPLTSPEEIDVLIGSSGRPGDA